MFVLAIAIQKAGSGKTTTAHALGIGLADLGRRVLLVDADPQASLTRACGVMDASGHSLAEVLGGAHPGPLSLGEILRPLGERLCLAPSDIALAATELGLVSRMGRENVLKRALAAVAQDFDVTIIDCPPSLGLLTVAALTAARGVLIPSQPQAADLRGLRLFLNTLQQIRDELNAELEPLGVLVTFYDARLAPHHEGMELLEDARLPILPVRIGRSGRVREAMASGQSVLEYAPDDEQAHAYRNLAKVIDQWLPDAQS